MTEHQSDAVRIPAWFRIASIVAIAWELLGCLLYIGQVTTDPATLPLDQRAIWDATPSWSIAANAVAVWVGLIGAGLLAMRRRAAVPALFISLIGVAVQFSALFLAPDLANSVSSDMALLPVVIFIVCYGIFHLALLGNKRGWLA